MGLHDGVTVSSTHKEGLFPAKGGRKCLRAPLLPVELLANMVFLDFKHKSFKNQKLFRTQ